MGIIIVYINSNRRNEHLTLKYCMGIILFMLILMFTDAVRRNPMTRLATDKELTVAAQDFLRFCKPKPRLQATLSPQFTPSTAQGGFPQGAPQGGFPQGAVQGEFSAPAAAGLSYYSKQWVKCFDAVSPSIFNFEPFFCSLPLASFSCLQFIY